VSEVQEREAWSETRARELIELHSAKRGPLLVILHALQDTFGYIDAAAVPLLADALNISRAEVHGVITFYRDLRDAPGGRRVVKVCRAESCQAVGAERLVEHATARLGVALGETTPDGAVTLEQVFCLGNCALGPAVMVDGRLVGRVDDARFDALITAGAGTR